MTVREVYLPVCVTLHDGVPVSACVVAAGPRRPILVHNCETEEWEPNPVGEDNMRLVDAADEWLGKALGPPA